MVDEPEGDEKQKNHAQKPVSGYPFFVAELWQSLNTAGGKVTDQLGITGLISSKQLA